MLTTPEVQPAVPPKSPPAAPAGRAGTPRAFVVGGLGAVAIGLGAPYGDMVLRGSYMALDFSTPGAIFLFFLLTAGGNALARRLRPAWGLAPAELALVYVMMTVACSIPTMGLTGQLLPISTSATYFATPANRWAETVAPRLPPWSAPRSPWVINRFYEGLKGGERPPYAAWGPPMAAWAPFIVALWVVSLCLMVILREQWVNRERLAFPLVHLPNEMARGGMPGERPLFRNPVMWVGFVVPFTVGSLIGLASYLPAVPVVPLTWTFPAFRGNASLILRISFPMIGFFFLANLETVFSLWFFNLLSWGIKGWMAILGVQWTENLGIFGTPSPIFAHLGMGAMLALVGSGLWMARPHLARVARKALWNDPTVDDSGEALSYRTAFWGAVLGLAFMAGWLRLAGLPALVIPVFLGAAFVLFLGMTRIVAESGLAEAVPTTIAPGFTNSALGTAAIGPTGLAVLGLSYVWCSDIRTFVMASSANGLKMTDLSAGSRRPFALAVLLGAALAAVASIALTLQMAYAHGGVNLNDWFFGGGAQAPWNWVSDQMHNPSPVRWDGLALTAAGAAGLLFLTAMRQRYAWWPFHPIGFVVGTTWIMDQIWFSAFIAWLLKALAVRYGSLRAFRAIRPFFLGLILGQFTCNGLWLVIDAFTGQRGNRIFWI